MFSRQGVRSWLVDRTEVPFLIETGLQWWRTYPFVLGASDAAQIELYAVLKNPITSKQTAKVNGQAPLTYQAASGTRAPAAACPSFETVDSKRNCFSNVEVEAEICEKRLTTRFTTGDPTRSNLEQPICIHAVVPRDGSLIHEATHIAAVPLAYEEANEQQDVTAQNEI